MMAFRAGAVQIDGSTRRLGAGAGDTPVEAFVAAAEKLGIRTGIDTLKIIDAAEDVVAPIMDEECRLDRLALLMGYAAATRASSSTRSARASATASPAPRSSYARGSASSSGARRIS
jgi:hypothetical protein